jgi:hypothetical protein
MAKKRAKPKEVSAHGLVAASPYCDLDKWVIAVLCTTIDQHALADPTIYDRLRKELKTGEELIAEEGL